MAVDQCSTINLKSFRFLVIPTATPMLMKRRIPLFLVMVFCLEAIIYFWAVWTTEAEFVFDKCARNSGRVSSMLNLLILVLIGHFSFKRIYEDEHKKNTFRILLSLFAINHLIHFFYVFQSFRSHSWDLSVSENLHGLITFIFIMIIPVLVWMKEKGGKLFFIALTLHLFNVSYFIMKTFYSKVQPDKPAYHNQFGILVTIAALFYVLFSFFREYRQRNHARA
jgi:hypothetical protein